MKKKEPGMVRLVSVLFVITLITSALLGCINYITADPIAETFAKKTSDAYRAVFEAETYIDAGYIGGDTLVSIVNFAVNGDKQAGWVVEVAPSGFGGTINMVVGMDMEGKVTGIAIVSMSETSGLGTRANENSFKSQFVGLSEEYGQRLAISKDGGVIDTITGATVTSRAVTKGVNLALEAVKHIS